MFYIRKYLIAALFFGLALGCTKTKPTSQDLVVGTNSGYPPYEMTDTTGKLIGFDIDIANALATKLGKKLVIKDMAFDALILALKQNKIDMILCGLSITPSRQQEITMLPYQGQIIKSFSLLFFAGIPENIKNINDVTHLGVVAVQTGTTQEVFLKNRQIPHKSLDTQPDLLTDVRYKKSVAALFEPQVAHDIMQKQKQFIEMSVPMQPSEYVLGNGIGISKDNTALATQLQKALADMKQSGELQNLEKKWFK